MMLQQTLRCLNYLFILFPQSTQNNVHVFQAPSKMESCENLFLPSADVYQIINNDENVLFENSPNPCKDPLSINECFMQSFFELATPNCMGVRFYYFDALSVSLQKLKPEIVNGLENGLENNGLNVENVILHTTV